LRSVRTDLLGGGEGALPRGLVLELALRHGRGLRLRRRQALQQLLRRVGVASFGFSPRGFGFIGWRVPSGLDLGTEPTWKPPPAGSPWPLRIPLDSGRSRVRVRVVPTRSFDRQEPDFFVSPYLDSGVKIPNIYAPPNCKH